MIVRADDRGLGNQTYEAWRHLQPETQLIVADGNTYTLHLDWYPLETSVVAITGNLLSQALGTFKDCTHVLSCETLYDWKLATELRSRGIKTIVQLNPELWPHAAMPKLPSPDQWWNPTSWRMEYLPFSARVVPVPVALDRFTNRTRKITERPRILHVVGRPAADDRNGTTPFLESLKFLDGVDITVLFQGPNVWPQPAVGRDSTLTFANHVGPYWTMYDDHDILVMPRRYGGLCLPVQEALAAGLVVVMTDCPPQSETWPIVPIPAKIVKSLNYQGGAIDVWECDPAHVAIKIKQAISGFDDYTGPGAQWAQEHSWTKLLPLYREELERVCTSQ